MQSTNALNGAVFFQYLNDAMQTERLFSVMNDMGVASILSLSNLGNASVDPEPE